MKNASLTYDADTKKLTLDVTGLSRTSNDNGIFNGIYATTLTEPLSKLHVFLDGSILDIFVNDRWAYSIRVFPTDADQVESEVFATASTPVKVSAWTLDAKMSTGIDQIVKSSNRQIVNCYDLQGRRYNTPQKGLYIQDGRKIVNRK